MHSSRMRTAHLLTISRSPGGSAQTLPRMQTLLDAEPRPLQMQTPLVNRMAHSCKNITLPQTLFAGRNACAASLLAWVPY